MKTIKSIGALALLLALLCACGAQPREVDVDALTQALQGLDFEDALESIDQSAISRLYTLEEGVTGQVWIGSGATAEEIAVFTCPDEATAQSVEDMLERHVESQRDSFRDYVPAELERLDQAVIARQGTVVALVVSADAAAGDTMKEYLG